jgi:hypothetical protein
MGVERSTFCEKAPRNESLLTEANIVSLAFLPPASRLIVAQIDHCASDFIGNLNVED